MNIIKFTAFFLLCILIAINVFADDEFLPAEEAFRIDVTVAGPGLVRAHWEIADNYYLYRDRMKFKAGDTQTTVGKVTFPKAKEKYDKSFDKIMFLYHDSVDIEIPVSTTGEKTSLSIRWQGCTEGLCYPPVTKKFMLDVPASDSPVAAASSTNTVDDEIVEDELTEIDSIQARMSGNIVVMFLFFFGFGFLLALTPCVLPMVPILSTIITGQENLSPRKAFSMSLIYVLSMAFTFALAGAGVGAAGSAALQNAYVLGTFGAILFALSLSMFGLYKLQLPEAMQSKLTAFSNKQEGGNMIGVAVMGALSALIVGPCITAPAAAALLFIAETGSHVIGFFALLGMGLGMGVPLLAIGTVAGSLVPKAGTWMIRVQHVFGFIILGLAIYIVDRVMNDTLVVLLSGMLIIGFGVYCNAFDHDSDKEPGWHTTFKALGLVAIVWGILLLFSAASGGKSLMQPLKGLSVGGGSGGVAHAEPFTFKKVASLDELDAEIEKAAAAGKPVMLDFFADWCTACIEYEHITFPHEDVLPLLNQMVLLQVDVTDKTDVDKEFQKRFKIVGPPSLVFFDNSGKELRGAKLVGFKKPAPFSEHLKKHIFK